MFSILMASHFKFYPSETETVVPFNATYKFPSQANKAIKITPRLPPKNGSVFTPNNTAIRLEFPAQGYVNPANTTLEFDVTLTAPAAGDHIIRFQNGIQSIFQRIRLLYGAQPIEDLIDANQIVRNLNEWTATNQTGVLDQLSISDGVGGVVFGTENGGSLGRLGLVNVRQAYIQGIDKSDNNDAAGTATATASAAITTLYRGYGYGVVPNTYIPSGATNSGVACTRRYQVSLPLGMFQQEKLIPTKWMASAFAIEITLEQPAGCIFAFGSNQTAADPSTTTYSVTNVNLIPEILEFDRTYDEMMFRGLREGGIPIKFSTWHTYNFTTAGSSQLNLQIQERSRSVKSLFAVMRRAPYAINTDSGATFFACTNSGLDTTRTSLQTFQWRIGGRYYPASPVQCTLSVGDSTSNGGCEAWVELQKALNTVGDYRLSSSCNALRWGISNFSNQVTIANGVGCTNSELDYCIAISQFSSGQPVATPITVAAANTGNCFSANTGSACFAMAIDLETSNGVEISGLNAEEQSDISLIATYSAAQPQNYTLQVFAYVDQIFLLKENNLVDLIY